MNTKTKLILGGLAVAGVGAGVWYYLKKKEEQELLDELMGGGDGIDDLLDEAADTGLVTWKSDVLPVGSYTTVATIPGHLPDGSLKGVF